MSEERNFIEQIKAQVFLETVLWCLKKFYEGFWGLYKTFWGTTGKCENKNLT